MASVTKLKPEEVRALEETLKSIVAAAVRAKGYADVIVRDILPEDDLGLSGTDNAWKLTLSSTGMNEGVISKTLSDDTAIVFYGVRNLDNNDVTQVRFRLGEAKVKAVFQIEKALTEEDATVYFEEPVIFKPNEVLNVDIEAPTSGDKKLVLLGFVAEPKGKVMIGAE